MVRRRTTDVDRIPTAMKVEKNKIMKLFGFKKGSQAYNFMFNEYKRKTKDDEIFRL